MTKYIERQYLLDTIDAMIVYRKTPTDIYEMVEDALTIDVVRCKDCKWHEDGLPGMVYCPAVIGDWVEEDWFCKGGERKEDEQETV